MVENNLFGKLGLIFGIISIFVLLSISLVLFKLIRPTQFLSLIYIILVSLFCFLGFIFSFIQFKKDRSKVSIIGLILSIPAILFILFIMIMIIYDKYLVHYLNPVTAITNYCTIYFQVGTYSVEPNDQNLIDLAYNYYKSIGSNVLKEELKVRRLGNSISVIITKNINENLMCSSDYLKGPYNCLGEARLENDKLLCDKINNSARSFNCLSSLKFENNIIFKGFANTC